MGWWQREPKLNLQKQPINVLTIKQLPSQTKLINKTLLKTLLQLQMYRVHLAALVSQTN
jgi:hypothetical protein